jgi:hypothetical protein
MLEAVMTDKDSRDNPDRPDSSESLHSAGSGHNQNEGMRAAPSAATESETETQKRGYSGSRSTTSTSTGTGTAKSTLLTGAFRDRTSAEQAYDLLIKRGYKRDDISLMMSDDTLEERFGTDQATEFKDEATEVGKTGAVTGAGTSTLVGAVSGAATLTLPGIGLVLAGPVATALAGLGVAGATGGVVGALVGSGIPEDRARTYERDIKVGRIVIAVVPRSESDAALFRREWKDFGGENIHWQ